MERLQIKNDIEGMKEALIEAKKAFAIGEIPIGAIICDDKGNIIARGHNLREKTFDATAHAEIVAIRKACTKLQNWRLSDLTLYVTVEPCPMCNHWLNHQTQIRAGVLEDECSLLVKKFFQTRRQNHN